ncbi:hypothetical protein AB0G73_24390 [Streptomyces sp. NPDC020719]|uniref:hypothetical protein n=1 Tax=Streptomyces sp. NPDC020719 TaxID=3154896 RepID=UPI0033F2CF8A
MSEYCTAKQPVPGTVRQLRTAHLGGKFSKLHGRWVGDCPDCKRAIGVTAKGNLMRHKPRSASK